MLVSGIISVRPIITSIPVTKPKIIGSVNVIPKIINEIKITIELAIIE